MNDNLDPTGASLSNIEKEFENVLRPGHFENFAGQPKVVGNLKIFVQAAGIIGTTLQNLKAAAEGENEEWSKLYPEFARVADEEGFKEIATAYRMIAKVEKAHETRYSKLNKNLEEGRVFEREGVVIWKCRNCGYLHEGKKAPKVCPACLHPQSYFEIQETNY